MSDAREQLCAHLESGDPDWSEAQLIIDAAVTEAEQLREARDEAHQYIVDKGLWEDYCAHLFTQIAGPHHPAHQEEKT